MRFGRIFSAVFVINAAFCLLGMIQAQPVNAIFGNFRDQICALIICAEFTAQSFGPEANYSNEF